MRPLTLATILLSSLPMLSQVSSAPAKDRKDALIAAPASHTVLLENARVRVLQVTIPPGATEPAHTHAWPSVMRLESPQPLTYITYAEQGGTLRETERFEVPMGKPGETAWAEPEDLHAVKNKGTSTFRAVRIELKPAQ